jgi:hypothetical protein
MLESVSGDSKIAAGGRMRWIYQQVFAYLGIGLVLRVSVYHLGYGEVVGWYFWNFDGAVDNDGSLWFHFGCPLVKIHIFLFD